MSSLVPEASSVDELFSSRAEALALVVSGPSGVGKTSVCKSLLERDDKIESVVTTTTRERRGGEIDGKDYHFVSVAAFDDLVSAGAFLEHAVVHGSQYGTTRQAFKKSLAEADLVLLEIDVQGAESLRSSLAGRCVTLFILPPSLDELHARLAGRKSEGAASLKLRTENALHEMSYAPSYDYVIVNHELVQAIGDVESVVRTERNRPHRQHALMASLNIR